MRTLTAAALTEIAKELGTEPLTLVEIDWGGGSVSQYADRAIAGIQGRILTIGQISAGINIEQAESTEVSVTLDDTDGEIKDILDDTDIHKKEATVYSYYGSLALSDKFEIFKGKISTPFQWGENDRQVTLSILAEIENFEVGFSPEESQLDFVSEDFVGVSWPLVFGECVHVPAQKVKQKDQARLLDMVCRHDFTIEWKQEEIEKAFQWEAFLFTFWRKIQEGADAMAPPAEQVLNNLIAWIKQEDLIFAQIVATQKLLDGAVFLAQNNPRQPGHRAAIRARKADLQILGILANQNAVKKKLALELVDLVEQEHELKKKAIVEQVAALNRMRNLYAEFLETVRILCEQMECEKTTVRVQEFDSFDDGVPVDVILKGVKMRVQFDHATSTMEIIEPVIDRYQDLEVEDWTPDDEPCTDIEEIAGLDMFRLALDNPPNIEKMFLLVKKRGTDDDDGTIIRHIIQVRKQIGKKVYFNLVRWDIQGSGSNRGVNLDKVIRGIEEDLEIQVGPFGNPIPPDLFQGKFDPNIWVQPEAQELLAILANIGVVNKDELRALAKLVFLKGREKNLGGLIIGLPEPKDVFTIVGEDIEIILAASGNINETWFDNYEIPYEEIPETNFWAAESGNSIVEAGLDCEIYIANILPSTVKAVHAYRTNKDGERFLAPVPSRYYIKNEAAPLGTYTVTAFTFPRALRNIPGEGWEDNIYVTMNSSVGPLVTDVMEWLIDTYTDKTINAASFAAVATKQTNYPANFFLKERPNVLQELQRIAWEARCALYIRNDEFHIKYLSEEPSTDETITETDIETESLIVSYSHTEELVTRLIATYNKSGLPLETGEKQPKYVLRHNIKKYGLHSSTEHFHIYNIPELVLKSATFWLIRRSNTWKKVTLKTFHTKIRLELFDTVLMDLDTPFFADSDTKCFLQAAVYDPGTNLLELTLDTGIKTGEMEQYVHYWPALDSPTDFPTSLEIGLGFAGGFGPGQGVEGTIDDCPPEPS